MGRAIDSSDRKAEFPSMLEQLRELVHAVPFVPFSIILPNGRSVKVPHPDFIWLHPLDKKTVMVALPTGGARIINVQLIVTLVAKRVKA